MKSIVSVSLLFLVLCAPLAAADDAAGPNLSVRSFQLRFREADKAAGVIKPLMSAQGTLSIQPSTNTLVVTDQAANVERIAGAIEKFDLPARSFRLELKLVSAGRAPQPAIPADLKDIAAKLSGVLKFNSFQKVGELKVEGKEGDPVIGKVDPYRAEFKFGEYDPVSGTIRLNEFQLSRVQGNELVPALRTSLNLRIGQMVVLGASKDPQSQRALMLVLVAREGS
jgi:hypothetical protein